MEFGKEKYAMLVMKSGKWHMTEGVELPNQVVIKTHGEKDTSKYFDASIQWLEKYIQKRGERHITASWNNTNNTITSKTTMTRKQSGKTNNPMNALSDQQATSHTRKRGRD